MVIIHSIFHPYKTVSRKITNFFFWKGGRTKGKSFSDIFRGELYVMTVTGVYSVRADGDQI